MKKVLTMQTWHSDNHCVVDDAIRYVHLVHDSVTVVFTIRTKIKSFPKKNEIPTNNKFPTCHALSIMECPATVMNT